MFDDLIEDWGPITELSPHKEVLKALFVQSERLCDEGGEDSGLSALHRQVKDIGGWGLIISGVLRGLIDLDQQQLWVSLEDGGHFLHIALRNWSHKCGLQVGVQISHWK